MIALSYGRSMFLLSPICVRDSPIKTPLQTRIQVCHPHVINRKKTKHSMMNISSFLYSPGISSLRMRRFSALLFIDLLIFSAPELPSQRIRCPGRACDKPLSDSPFYPPVRTDPVRPLRAAAPGIPPSEPRTQRISNRR